jgi:hypothetical protein
VGSYFRASRAASLGNRETPDVPKDVENALPKPKLESATSRFCASSIDFRFSTFDLSILEVMIAPGASLHHFRLA